MRILFIGDIVGRSGRTAVLERLPGLIADWKLDFVVVNGENAAGGFGITEAIYHEFLDAGADVDHARQSRLGPARGAGVHRARAAAAPPAQLSARHARPRRRADRGQERRARAGRSTPWAASSWTRSTIRSPRSSASSPPARSSSGADAIVVDMHAEATSEKQAMGHFCDGRASLVVGTHTHVPTADHRILPGGTAFMSDVGMTGDYNSVIGMDKDEPLSRFLRKIPGARFEPAIGAGDAVRRRGRDRRRHRPGAARSARCGSAAGWRRRGRRSGARPERRRFWISPAAHL